MSNETTIPPSSSPGKPSSTYSSFGKGSHIKEKRSSREKSSRAMSGTSESDACSSYSSKLKTKSKTLSSKGLNRLSQPESNFNALDNRLSLQSDPSYMQASSSIVTPPSSFNDFPIGKSATIDRKWGQMKTTHALASSLQNDISHLASPARLPENLSTRKSSVSLDRFDTKSVQTHDNEKCSCKSSKVDIPARKFETEMSESDLSDVNIPPPPLPATFQQSRPRKQISHDAQSDCSTTV